MQARAIVLSLATLATLATARSARAQRIFEEHEEVSPLKQRVSFFGAQSPEQPKLIGSVDWAAPDGSSSSWPTPKPRVKERVVEVALGERVHTPTSYTIDSAKVALAAGVGVGEAIELRFVAFRYVSFDLQVATLRLTSRDSRLSDTRIWHVIGGADYRLHLGRIFALRPCVRLGDARVAFDDADAITTVIAV